MHKFHYWFVVILLYLPSALHAFDPYSLEGQILAQATCTALNPQKGWTFAVARRCDKFSASCEQVCVSLSDGDGKDGSSAGPLKCFNSINIYGREPFQEKYQLGLKVFKYNHCGGNCGPNYCCCTNANANTNAKEE